MHKSATHRAGLCRDRFGYQCAYFGVAAAGVAGVVAAVAVAAVAAVVVEVYGVLVFLMLACGADLVYCCLLLCSWSPVHGKCVASRLAA